MIEYHIIKTPKKTYSYNNQHRAKLTQEQLDTYLKESKFKLHDFVVYVSTSNVISIGQVDLIVDINTDAESVDYEFANYAPKPFKIMTLVPMGTSALIHTRDSTLEYYRKLTEEEWDKVIKPNLDSVQNRLEQFHIQNKTQS